MKITVKHNDKEIVFEDATGSAIQYTEHVNRTISIIEAICKQITDLK